MLLFPKGSIRFRETMTQPEKHDNLPPRDKEFMLLTTRRGTR